MPVWNGADCLERSLPPLLRRVGGDLLEVIVVDDGSDDGSGDLAARLGARVVAGGSRQGPAAARNRGAEVASGEVLLFVDADVVVHDDAVARAREALAEPGLDAVFGSYDDRPEEPGFASLYMNLRHHFIHQRSAGPISTFWAGCGGMRAETFRAAGGFDAARYPHASIEDVELGMRVTRGGGRIRLDPAVQGTHLKRWTVGGVLHTDVARRARPWAELLARGGVGTELNMSPRERVSALVAWAFAVSIPLALAGVVPFAAPLLALAAAAWLQRELLALFARRGGRRFALGALLWHQLYYCYATATFALVIAGERLRGPRTVME